MDGRVERRGGMGVMPVTVVCGCLCSLAGSREGASVVLEQRRVVSGLPSATISGSSRKRERGNEKMNGKEKH